MPKIKLLEWTDEPPPDTPYLLKLGYVGLDLAAMEVLGRAAQTMVGLVPPFLEHNLQYNFSCLSVVRDHFPGYPIYAPVPRWCLRDSIRSVKSAGFRHFVIPFQAPWSFTHQQVHDLLEGVEGVHVAGGDPEVEGLEWTWSEEGL